MRNGTRGMGIGQDEGSHREKGWGKLYGEWIRKEIGKGIIVLGPIIK